MNKFDLNKQYLIDFNFNLLKTISSMNDNGSPSSHGCQTPTKKPKRPPNYGGYHEEHSDGLNEAFFNQ